LTWAFLGLLVLGEILGCSSSLVSDKTEGLEDLQPVSGSVSFEGKPTPGAIVLFFPINNPKERGIRIAGEVDEEGIFEMMTGVSQGALPGVKEGKYVVTVTWTKLENPDDKDSDVIDLVPVRYGDPEKSPLRAEVVDGENELKPFELVP
jgi:hypothetical protein